MRTLCVLIGALIVSLPASAAVYKYVEEDGTVVYSDQPREGAEQVELPESSVYEAPGSKPADETAKSEKPADKEAKKEETGPIPYQSLNLVEPTNDTTIWNVNGMVEVKVESEPPLQEGHSVRVLVDGEPKATSTDPAVSLEGVLRGTHTLSAQIVDDSGEVRLTSNAVTIHMKRHTVPKGQRNPQTGRKPLPRNQ